MSTREEMQMADRIQIRRDTATNWTSANPTLASGEWGYETDTGKLKIGTGSTTWTSLGYFAADVALSDLGVSATAAELNYLDGVTSAVQTQLDAKAETLTDLGLSATTVELNYVDGVTSAIQTQLDAKAETLTDLGITDGTNGQVLTTNGSGTFTFQDTASGGGGGSFEAVASGSLSDGSTVVLNSDGTVSVVAQGVVASATSSLGTITNSSAADKIHAVAYDNVNNLILFVTKDGNNLECTAGSISSGSITFGATSTIPSWQAYDRGGIFAFFDSASQKFVVVGISLTSYPYSPYGVAVTVDSSTKAISFGSNVQLMSGSGNQLAIAQNPTTGHILGFTSNSDNSGYSVAFLFSVVGGTLVKHQESVPFSSNPGDFWANYDSVLDKFIIGTNSAGGSRFVSISNNTMSFSTPTVTGVPNSMRYSSSAYNTTNNNHVITYADQNNNYDLYAVCAVATSSTLSYNTPVLLTSAPTTTANLSVAPLIHDPISEKMVVFTNDTTNTKAFRLDIDNNGVISSSTAFTFSGSDVVDSTRPVYDSTTQKVIVATSASTTVTINSFTTGGNVSTNLTEENYAGIADAVYADAATATIQTAGSVDDAQSGLTSGQAYYVQANGTLGLNPGTPRVFAGVAVSATKLLIGKEGPAATVTLSDLSVTATAEELNTVTAKLNADSVIDGGTV